MLYLFNVGLAMLTRGDHKLKGHSLNVELLSEKPVHSPGSGITPNDQQCPLRSEKTRELPKSGMYMYMDIVDVLNQLA